MKKCLSKTFCIFLMFVLVFATVSCSKDVTYVDKTYEDIHFQLPEKWSISSDKSSNSTILYVDDEENPKITLSLASVKDMNSSDSKLKLSLSDYTQVSTSSYSNTSVTYSNSKVSSSDKQNVSIGDSEYSKPNDIELSKTPITYDCNTSDNQTINFTSIVCCFFINGEKDAYQLTFETRTDDLKSYKENINKIVNSIKTK